MVAIRNPESQPEGPKIRNLRVFSMVAIRVANRVTIRVSIRNPESQPEGPEIRNPGGFSMVAIRVANRVANRVSIAISQPETFWNESGLRIELQP